MKLARWIAFALGVATLVALTVYADAGAVTRALAALGVVGLALIALLHLPVIALLGTAWWQIGGEATGGTIAKFLWARLVRDAAAEVLPFSQAGGYVLGVRAMHLRGIRPMVAALSMSVDLVTELWAKIPYIVLGLGALFLLAPHSSLVRATALALLLTVVIATLPLLLKGRLQSGVRALAMRLSARWPGFDRAARDEMDAPFAQMLANRGRLAFAFGLHLFCWLLAAAETWVIFALMGRYLTAPQALAIDSLVSALRTFAFLVPAAAGVQEASYVLVCALFGLPPALALAASFARRAREIVIGVPAFVAWQILEGRARLRAAASEAVCHR